MRVAWTIQLTGHPFDLEDQRHWTLGNPIHVAKADAERYDLVLPIAVVGENHEQAQTHAQKVLVALNGMGVRSRDPDMLAECLKHFEQAWVQDTTTFRAPSK